MPDTSKRAFITPSYALGILILFIAGIKWAWHLPSVMDITFGDEAQYLRYGTDLFHTVKKDWGPSYNIWYKCLSLFQSNPVKLFYLNYQVTGILIALTLYVFLIRYSVPSVISLWLSFCFLLSTTVIDTWPRVSHFAVIVLLLFLIAVRDIHSNAKKLLLISLAFYIAAYARPELFSSFLFISVATIYALFKERKDFKNWLPVFIVVAVILLLNFLIYQLPANFYKGIDRTYIAFSQHYAINYVIEHKASFNPISEWIDFAYNTFGACTNFGCILKTHPELVLHNSLLNLQKYLLTLLQFVVHILFPAVIIGKKIIQLGVLLFLLAIVSIVLFHKASRLRFLEQVRAHILLLFVLFLFGLPSMGASILIFPRQHYLLMHSILIIFIFALLLNSISLIRRIHPLTTILLCSLLLMKSPTAANYSYYQLDRDSKNQCNRKLVEYISAQNDRKPHTVFSNHLSLSMLLPVNFSDFNTEYEYKPGMRFNEIVKEKKIDYIVVRDILLQEKLLSSDSTWTNFIRHPEASGFVKTSYCDSCESYLLVKKEE
ncbi:MAG: hypothetical protein U0T77_03725 [Chitinophagales bacterium]